MNFMLNMHINAKQNMQKICKNMQCPTNGVIK